MARLVSCKFLDHMFQQLIKKGKIFRGIKGSKIEDFIFSLSHRKAVLSRGTHQKSLGKGRGIYHSKSSISLLHWTCPVDRPDSRDFSPDSRKPHRTWPDYRGSSRTPEASIRLDRWTRLVQSLASFQRVFTRFQRGPPNLSTERFPDSSVWGGSCNRLLPALETVTHSQEMKYTPKFQFLSSLLSSLPKLHSWILFLREDLSSLECATFK
jgi:hypothetical protein